MSLNAKPMAHKLNNMELGSGSGTLSLLQFSRNPLASLQKVYDVMRIRRRIILVLTIASIGLFITPAFAVRLYPEPRVCAEYFRSESVFTGKVMSVKTVIDSEGFIDGYWYRIKAYGVFRGKSRKYFKIYIGNDSGEYPMDVGKEYLLFAYREGNYLTIYSYGNSCLLSKAKEKIHEIEEIPNKTDGEVECQVGLGGGLSDVKVKINGDDTCYIAITDSVGRFLVKVKPGSYRAAIEPQCIGSRNFEFRAFDLSYDNPNCFSVPKGGCAEIFFSPSLKK